MNLCHNLAMTRLLPLLVAVFLLSLSSTEGWSLPSCPEDPSKYYDNCFGTFSASGDKYVGEWKDDKAHGQGTYTFADGDKYVGEFRDDKRNGRGTYYALADDEFKGDKYVGEFRDDKKHGEGTYTFASGAKYLGEFRDNNYHGQGTLYAADGTVLQEGYWEDNELVRSAKVEDRDTSYAAQSDLLPCPEDPFKYYDNCFGTYTFADGDKYVGEWKDDKQHGQGTYTFVAGDKYVGEFRDNKKHGQGTYTYAAGAKYVGEFRDNNFHGQGTYTFADGNKYVGEFRDDNFHGQGTLYAVDGTVLQEGYWEDDEFMYAQSSPEPGEDEETVHEPSVTADPDEIFAAASGSGFAVSSSGYVVTNHHVVDGCIEVKIQHEGTSIPVTIVAYDPINDLALLKGDFIPAETFPLSRRNPKLMQEIFVAGYPFGKSVSSSLKVTRGIVSSLTGIGNNVSHIQIDAALQPGNSGGPIFNDRGNVVAVAVSKLDLMEALEGWGVVPENTNFGIKSSVVVNLLDSNNVRLKQPNAESMSTDRLGEMISNSTFYLSCWMTLAQIEELRSKKVLFDNLN
jgi:hypothetical protein